MQQFLKPASGIAGAGIIATELLRQLFVTVNDAAAAFDAGLGREALLSLTGRLESCCRRGVAV
jgi:hypothetical protein